MTKAIESGMAKLRIEEAATRKQVRWRREEKKRIEEEGWEMGESNNRFTMTWRNSHYLCLCLCLSSRRESTRTKMLLLVSINTGRPIWYRVEVSLFTFRILYSYSCSCDHVLSWVTFNLIADITCIESLQAYFLNFIETVTNKTWRLKVPIDFDKY